MTEALYRGCTLVSYAGGDVGILIDGVLIHVAVDRRRAEMWLDARLPLNPTANLLRALLDTSRQDRRAKARW